MNTTTANVEITTIHINEEAVDAASEDCSWKVIVGIVYCFVMTWSIIVFIVVDEDRYNVSQERMELLEALLMTIAIPIFVCGSLVAFIGFFVRCYEEQAEKAGDFLRSELE